ncbi:uncharacterized protein SCHCODRAFT_01253144 [Schizophyllum commune H4-8]|uniref:uncharacterized protein n=1 Tax=Schizophyllum commune (strain H4-8 / FGSC 9210) TaxID=578458 RepID=UPI002160481C|nr:uncharacterized protein SCHCODRAFT_01253144 [Schizophyllum commune H4-8]KAI5898917.1 hypothetical protein SCHCODRAFT_01253144 [Schizophyllum commune H4-8]
MKFHALPVTKGVFAPVCHLLLCPVCSLNDQTLPALPQWKYQRKLPPMKLPRPFKRLHSPQHSCPSSSASPAASGR